ncbi:MAG: class I SAM-dependent methyltransferase [Prevotellaceae bacterium]|jgi:ubiquinone/menaquinone biosynthesis C-methylase UbiE|nr:class I SAM-dependent methyltransferase [Prevotellaceae bacterium]
MSQQAYWESAGAQKEFTTPLQLGAFQALVHRSARVLDLGCGYGRTLSELHRSGYTNTVGVDFSAKMVERGRSAYPHLTLQAMGNGTAPFADNAFDSVLLLAVLTCIASDDEQAQLLREARRVLKPGGVLYVNDFLLNTDERNRKRYDEFYAKHHTYGVFELPDGAILRHHSRKAAEEKLQYFEKICFEEITYPTMNGHQSNGYYYFGKK